jgi:hypothetical protein
MPQTRDVPSAATREKRNPSPILGDKHRRGAFSIRPDRNFIEGEPKNDARLNGEVEASERFD